MKEFIRFMRFLYESIGWKLYAWVIFIAVAALLDGLSVGFFFPILEADQGASELTKFLNGILGRLGLTYSIVLAVVFVLILFLLRTFFLIVQELFASRLMTRVLAKSKREVIEKIFAAEYLYFASRELGYFNNAVTIEYNNVTFAFRCCMRLLVNGGFAIVYFSLPLFVNFQATIVVLALGIPLHIALRRANVLTRRYSFRFTDINSRVQSMLIQLLTNFRYLKSTNTSKTLVRKVSSDINEQSDIMFKQSIVNASVGKSTELFTILLAALIILYNELVVGDPLIQIVFLLFVIRRAVNYALASYTDYREFVGSSGSIAVFKKLEKELADNQEPVANSSTRLPEFTETISLRDIHVSYDGKTDVLSGVNIEISPLKTVAIVGESGAGKSTIAGLLTGVIKPKQGSLFIGDCPYVDMDLSTLRESIGYVTQENVIFTDTLRNNITLWDETGGTKNNEGSETFLRSVINKSSLTEFVDGLPEGLDTQLGDNGLNLSGGQRQRVCIARELYKKINLLILDEATSALDSISEREIQNSIEAMSGGLTIAVIAHRLSTIKNADLIVVLHNGKVAESGTFEELYALEGRFRKTVDYQEISVTY